MKNLNELLRAHELWLKGEGGKRADLREADLREADLRRADLRRADLREADLRRADLQGADLQGADLQGADLREADLDFSCLPLWCGSLFAHYDDKQLVQIAYHLVCAGLHSNNASPEVKLELTKLIDLANRFHRVDECGRLAQKGGGDK